MRDLHQQNFPSVAEALSKEGIGLRFGQLGEDCYLWHRFYTKVGGSYVDVGAHHPTNFSNTYLLHKFRRWSGINIEPNPDLIAEFNKERPNDINLNLGIANTDQELTYYLFDHPGVNTFDPVFAREIGKLRTLQEKRMVQCKPLHTVLAEHCSQEIDYMNVDCEGLDLDVLKSNDWSKFRPFILSIEIHKLDTEQILDSEVYKYMKKQEYKLVAHYKPTAFFERL